MSHTGNNCSSRLRVQAFQQHSAPGNSARRSQPNQHAPRDYFRHQQHHENVEYTQLQRPEHHPHLHGRQQQRAQNMQPITHLLPLPNAPRSSAQQRRVLPHPLCVLDPPVLTHQIKQCSCWLDVAVLFAKQSQCMNHINLAALITHLAHLRCSPSSRPVNWNSFICQVLSTTEPQLHLCGPRQLSNMAWALASLGYTTWVDHSCSWSQQWQQALLNTLHTASCRDVSNILWALATSTNSCSSTGSANDCKGQKRRKHRPLVLQERQYLLGSQLQQELLSALHRTLSNSNPQDVANTLWSLATLQLQPSSELGQYLLARAQVHFSCFKPQEVAHVVWAVSQLQLQPAGSWLQELLLRQIGRPHWEGTSVQHHVMCLLAYAHMNHVPPDKWVAQTLQQLERLLLLPPTQQQQQQQQGSGNFVYCSGDSIAAKDHLQSTSGSNRGSSSDLHSNNRSSSSNRSQDLANTIWALGTLRLQPNSAWMQHFVAASRTSLAQSEPQELSNTIWGLARLKALPDQAWLEAFDAASLAAMRGFTAQGLADVLASQVHLRLQPSGAWKEEWMQALRRVWGSADASAVCKTLWAAAKLQLPLGRSWLQQALQESHGEVHGALVRQELTNEELLRLVYAVGRLCKGYLTQDMSDMLGLYCCRIAGKMTWQQLQRGAWGLARLKPLPAQQLTSYFADLAASRVKYMPPHQAVQVEEKLQVLRHAAEVGQLQAAVQQAMRQVEDGIWQQQQMHPVTPKPADALPATAMTEASQVHNLELVQLELAAARQALEVAQQRSHLGRQLPQQQQEPHILQQQQHAMVTK